MWLVNVVACSEGYYMCNDRTCLPSNVKCNGLHDCSEGEDEDSCTTTTTTTGWLSNKYCMLELLLALAYGCHVDSFFC